MQEEVENKSINLAVTGGKLTVKLLIKALQAWYRHHQRKKDVARMAKDTVKGKQSVKKLIGQGQGVSSMDISDKGIRDFKRIANKYGVDFAIVKSKEPEGTKYTVFFKAKDADAIAQVLKDYANRQKRKVARAEKPSILQKLKMFKEKVAGTPHKQREKRKEQTR